MALILSVALLVVFVLGLPFWRHSRNWGYGPSSIVAFIFVFVLLLTRMGDIPRGF